MRRSSSTLGASIVLGLLACIEGCSTDAGGDTGQSTHGNDVTGASDATATSGSSGVDGSTAPGNRAEDPGDTTPRVRYVGRTDTSDKAGPRLAWPGTRIIVRFRGPAMNVKVSEQNVDDGPSRYDVTIDGVLKNEPLVPHDGDGEYVLASALAADKPHVLELYRRTEAMVGITQILGFEFPGGGELLAPPPWPNRRIEFLGDSESTGYGVECASPSETFTGATQNERKAFPALAAKRLEAESHNVAYSGKGITRNEVPNTTLFGELYMQSIPDVSEASAWDFSWKPDVVWITLGANDWGPGGSGNEPAPDPAFFKAKYRAFVELVRSKNPNSQIVCSVQGMLNDDWPVGWKAYTNVKTILQAIVDERRAAGDAKVHLHELPRAIDSRDLTGCSGHPNAAYHESAAASVASKIASITGWP